MKDLERLSIWTAYNAAQSEEKTRFVALLADLCSTVPRPPRQPPNLLMGSSLATGAKREADQP